MKLNERNVDCWAAVSIASGIGASAGIWLPSQAEQAVDSEDEPWDIAVTERSKVFVLENKGLSSPGAWRIWFAQLSVLRVLARASADDCPWVFYGLPDDGLPGAACDPKGWVNFGSWLLAPEPEDVARALGASTTRYSAWEAESYTPGTLSPVAMRPAARARSKPRRTMTAPERKWFDRDGILRSSAFGSPPNLNRRIADLLSCSAGLRLDVGERVTDVVAASLLALADFTPSASLDVAPTSDDEPQPMAPTDEDRENARAWFRSNSAVLRRSIWILAPVAWS